MPVLLLAVGSLDLRPARPEAPPRVLVADWRSGALLAGAGKAEVELPPGVALAGYRPFGRPARRPGAPTHVRALILEAGGLRTGVLLVELLTLPPSLAGRLRARAAAEGLDCVLLVATHTHAGPGGYDRAFVPQAAAVGRFDERVEAALEEGAALALATARADLGAAEVAIGEARLDGLSKNRDRKGAPVDDRFTRVDVRRPDGTPVARLLRHAAHPTLTPRTVGPTGGWPSVTMGAVEEGGGVAFLLPGAIGDANARMPRGGIPKGERDGVYGALVAGRAGEVPLRELLPPTALGCAEVELDLPEVDLSGPVPSPFASLTSNLVTPFSPDTARVAALRIDDLVLVGVPAEPTAAAAAGAEAALAEAGLRVRTVGLSQGYVGYASLPADLAEEVFSAKLNWFGAALAPRLAAAVRTVALTLVPPRPAGVPAAAPLPRAEAP